MRACPRHHRRAVLAALVRALRCLTCGAWVRRRTDQAPRCERCLPARLLWVK